MFGQPRGYVTWCPPMLRPGDAPWLKRQGVNIVAILTHEQASVPQKGVLMDSSMASGYRALNEAQAAIGKADTLDYTTSIEVLEVMEDIVGQGTTMVMVTHNEEICRMADRVVRMRGGRVNEVSINRRKAHAADLVW